MPARAGRLPWNEYDSRGRARSVIQGKDNMEYDISSGWHPKYQQGWTKNVKREQVEMIDFQGKIHKVYRYDLPDSITGFRAHEGNNAQRQESLAIMEDAFSDTKRVLSIPGVGHIKLLEYVEKNRILRVTFTNNNAVCVYFDVPTFVAGRLFYFATHRDATIRTSNGLRHKLGVEFWDLVRIRGHQHGSKFPFEYVSHGSGTILHNNRHVVKIPGYGSLMTVLNDTEFKAHLTIEGLLQTLQQLKNKYSGLEIKKKGKKVKDGEEADDVNIDDIAEYSTDDAEAISSIQQSIANLENMVSNSALGRMLDNAKKYVDEIVNNEAYQAMYGDIANDRQAREEFLRNEREVIPELNLLDARTGKLKNFSSRKEFAKHRNLLEQFDEDGVYSWMLPGKRQRNMYGRGWTEEDLIKAAYNLDKSQEDIYKVYINRKDWHGALSFLKSAAKRGTYKDNASGSRKAIKAEKYASEYDFLESDFEDEDKED